MDSNLPEDRELSIEDKAKILFDLHEQIDAVNHPPTEEEILEFYQAVGQKPELELYLNEEEQQYRRIAFIHCEDDTCGFILEFKFSNCTYFFCKGHGNGINLDLDTVPPEGVNCELHGPMERVDLIKGDNMCPRCEATTVAIVSIGR